MKPLLSVVIVNYNYGHFLETAILSVVEQECFDKCELIVVDGGSDDNSVEIIKKYANRIAWWVSEKDRGQSDAFNKGFAHAKGVYGCWVNADDLLLPGAIRSVIDIIDKDPQHVDWIGGGTIWMDANLRIKKCSMIMRYPYMIQRYMPGIMVGGPSAFFRLELLRKLGGFDVRMYYMMDHDLWLRLSKSGARLIALKKYVWAFRLHEQSKTSGLVKDSGVSGKVAVATDDSVILESRYPRTMRYWPLICRVIQVAKIFNGCYFRSWLDTRRFNGKYVTNLNQ